MYPDGRSKILQTSAVGGASLARDVDTQVFGKRSTARAWGRHIAPVFSATAVLRHGTQCFSIVRLSVTAHVLPTSGTGDDCARILPSAHADHNFPSAMPIRPWERPRNYHSSSLRPIPRRCREHEIVPRNSALVHRPPSFPLDTRLSRRPDRQNSRHSSPELARS